MTTMQAATALYQGDCAGNRNRARNRNTRRAKYRGIAGSYSPKFGIGKYLDSPEPYIPLARQMGLGELVCSPGVLMMCRYDKAFKRFVCRSVLAHASGDRGNLCGVDTNQGNENTQVISCFEYEPELRGTDETYIYITTSAGGAETAVMLPEEALSYLWLVK